MAAPTDNLISVNYAGSTVEAQNAGVLEGRTVTQKRSRCDDYMFVGKAGGITALASIISLIAGTSMWGPCNDPTAEGCNHAIRTTGIVFVSLGGGLLITAIGLIYKACNDFGNWHQHKMDI